LLAPGEEAARGEGGMTALANSAAVPQSDQTPSALETGASKSSFYLAMKVLPKERRDAMFAIYAFCRDVDDIADEPAPQELKQQQLAMWRDEIDGLYAGRAAITPTGRTLAGPITRFGLKKDDFLAVIDGMATDAERDIQAPSLAELDLYCDRVASAVGRLSVRVFGEWREKADEVADHLGRALQLTNILRDLDEDAERNRLYLPLELLQKHGIATTEPQAVLAHPALTRVCRDLARIARDHYAGARRAMAHCPRSEMRPAVMMGAVYGRMLDIMEVQGWDAPRKAVKLPKLVKLWLAFRAGYLPF
jgi:phytoene synthase